MYQSFDYSVLPKGSNTYISKHFRSKEFDCPCTFAQCKTTRVNKNMMIRLEHARRLIQKAIFITRGGGFRCALYQQDLRDRGYNTAKKQSQHELGNAADITVAANIKFKMKLRTIVKRIFQAMGDGIHKHGFLHVDMRDDKKRRWSYNDS